MSAGNDTINSIIKKFAFHPGLKGKKGKKGKEKN